MLQHTVLALAITKGDFFKSPTIGASKYLVLGGGKLILPRVYRFYIWTPKSVISNNTLYTFLTQFLCSQQYCSHFQRALGGSMHRLWGSLAATQQLRTIPTQVPQQPGLASMAETSKTKHITRCNYKPTITSQNLPWTRFLQHFPEAFSFGCRHNQLVVGHSKCNGSVHPCAAITIEILTIRQLPFFSLFWHLTLSIYP